MPITADISNSVFAILVSLIGAVTGGITIFLLSCCYSYKLHSWLAHYTPLYLSYCSAVPWHLVPLPYYPIPQSGPLSIHYVSVQPQDTIFPLISILLKEAYESTVHSTVAEEARDIGKEGINILATEYPRGPTESLYAQSDLGDSVPSRQGLDRLI
ncbi:uncharacterized protein ARMOST_13832 [Armillaria ostoyae]|uniref:Uncharacterized protein n=1 Tax=Armillaria ostoyae TaxID=47428 RepID=A0A284RNT4_ARMOS|nr:uncharacterized protein ARMOST_13832 [Armillaria ostoyae]